MEQAGNKSGGNGGKPGREAPDLEAEAREIRREKLSPRGIRRGDSGMITPVRGSRLKRVLFVITSLAAVSGAVLLLAAKTGIPLVQPKPSEVKMAVCGNGRAEKGQVERMITRILNMDNPTGQDDAADALAIALTGLAMDNYSSLTKSGDRS
jgi:hypothetical protein